MRLVSLGGVCLAIALGVAPLLGELGVFGETKVFGRVAIWVVVYTTAYSIQEIGKWGFKGRRLHFAKLIMADRFDGVAGLIRDLNRGSYGQDRLEQGILLEVVQIVQSLTGRTPETNIHADLIVPKRSGKGKRVTHLQVVNTSRSVASTPPRTIDLAESSPAKVAFESKKPMFVADTLHCEYGDRFVDRDYRTLACFPVIGNTGEVIAVVSIDAAEPHLLSEQSVEKSAVDKGISACLELLALTRNARS